MNQMQTHSNYGQDPLQYDDYDQDIDDQIEEQQRQISDMNGMTQMNMNQMQSELLNANQIQYENPFRKSPPRSQLKSKAHNFNKQINQIEAQSRNNRSNSNQSQSIAFGKHLPKGLRQPSGNRKTMLSARTRSSRLNTSKQDTMNFKSIRQQKQSQNPKIIDRSISPATYGFNTQRTRSGLQNQSRTTYQAQSHNSLEKQMQRQQDMDYAHKLYDEMQNSPSLKQFNQYQQNQGGKDREIVNLDLQSKMNFQPQQNQLFDPSLHGAESQVSEKQIESKVFEFLNNIYFKNQSPSKDSNGNDLANYQPQPFPMAPPQPQVQPTLNQTSPQIPNRSSADELIQLLLLQQKQQPLTQYQQTQSIPPISSQQDINSIKATTDNLGQEMKEMRKQIMDMQMNGSEKDTEIIKLNMHLADEKKKMQDLIRTNKNQSYEMASPVKDRDNDRIVKDIKKEMQQVQDDNEQFKVENKQLKKKVEHQKKQTLQEMQNLKHLKKEMRELEQKLNSAPQNHEVKELEQKYIQKIEKMKNQQKESEKELKEEFTQEKNKLKTVNEDMQQQVKKALKIHKENQQLIYKADQLKEENKNINQEKTLMQQTILGLNDKVGDLQKQIINLESENEKIQEIRKLEKQKNKIHTASSELETKVCENCVESYQKLEDSQLSLKEALKKIERLDFELKQQQMSSPQKVSTNLSVDQTEDHQTLIDQNKELQNQVFKLQNQNEQLKGRVELLDEKVKESFSASIVKRNDSFVSGNSSVGQKDSIIKELSIQVTKLKQNEVNLVQQIQQLQRDLEQAKAASQNVGQGAAAGSGDNAEKDEIIAKLNEKLKNDLAEKDKVIGQVSEKMQAEMMKSMEMMPRISELEQELSVVMKQRDNISTQLEELKDSYEKIANPKEWKKKQKLKGKK